MACSTWSVGGNDPIMCKQKPPPGSSASQKSTEREPFLPLAPQGNLQRTQSLQWRDGQHLEEQMNRSTLYPESPFLKRAKSLTKLDISRSEGDALKKHLSTSTLLALSDTSLSLKEALPVKVFSDKGSTLGEEKRKFTAYAQTYYEQLVNGCGKHNCSSVFCNASPNCPELSEEMKVCFSFLLSLTKSRYICSRSFHTKRAFPIIPQSVKTSGPVKTHFLTKLFSMSSFNSLFRSSSTDNSKPSHPTFELHCIDRLSSIKYQKEKSGLQLGTTSDSTIPMIFSQETSVCPFNEENVLINSELDQGLNVQTKDSEQFSLTHLTVPMLQSVIDQYLDCGDNNFIKATLRTVFASSDALAQSFLDEDSENGQPGAANLKEVDKCFKMLTAIDQKHELYNEICNSTTIMLSSLKLQTLKTAQSVVWPLMITLRNPELFGTQEIPLRLGTVLLDLNSDVMNVMVDLLCSLTKEELDSLILQFQNVLSSITEVRVKCFEDVFAMCVTLKVLYQANIKIFGQPLPQNHASLFYNSNFSKSLDLVQELTEWKRTNEEKKSSEVAASEEKAISWENSPIGKFSFLLLPETKIQMLHLEAMMQMKDEYQTALIHQVKIQHMHKVARGLNLHDLSPDVRAAVCPYLVLNVSRENIVRGTLDLLKKKEKDLKKPLKVVFTGKGEHGLDLGGLQKEFFQIFFQEIFNAEFRLFQSVGETGHSWFCAHSPETSELYKVVGMVIGIAIYNGIILDLQFPEVLYRKLLGFKVRLEDLEEIQPTVAHSLRELLTYEGDIESTFCLTFQITQHLAGDLALVDLVQDGKNIPVTKSNRNLFVDLYVEYMLTKSVAIQFNAFSEGFYKVCGDGAVSLFGPYELELLICGSPELDFHALQKVTTYFGGFCANHYLIKEFWRIVHNLSDKQKRKVLKFVTGSHRVPVGGLGALSFAIQRNGSNTDNLPTAMTCFNRLFLPNYSDERILEMKLVLAIENCQGFGLV